MSDEPEWWWCDDEEPIWGWLGLVGVVVGLALVVEWLLARSVW